MSDRKPLPPQGVITAPKLLPLTGSTAEQIKGICDALSKMVTQATAHLHHIGDTLQKRDDGRALAEYRECQDKFGNDIGAVGLQAAMAKKALAAGNMESVRECVAFFARWNTTVTDKPPENNLTENNPQALERVSNALRGAIMQTVSQQDSPYTPAEKAELLDAMGDFSKNLREFDLLLQQARRINRTINPNDKPLG